MSDDLLRDLANDLPFDRPDATRRDRVRSSLLVEASLSDPATSSSTASRRRIALAGVAFAAGAMAAAAIALVVLTHDRPEPASPFAAEITASAEAQLERTTFTTATGLDEVVQVHTGTVRVSVDRMRSGDHVRAVTVDAEVEGTGVYEVHVVARSLDTVRVTSGTAAVKVRGQHTVMLAAGQTWRASIITTDLSPPSTTRDRGKHPLPPGIDVRPLDRARDDAAPTGATAAPGNVTTTTNGNAAGNVTTSGGSAAGNVTTKTGTGAAGNVTTSGAGAAGNVTTSGAGAAGNVTTTTGAGAVGNVTTKTGRSAAGNVTTKTGGSAAGNVTTTTGTRAAGNVPTKTGGSAAGNVTTTTGAGAAGNVTTTTGAGPAGNVTTKTGGSAAGNVTTKMGGSAAGNVTTKMVGSAAGNVTTKTGGNPAANVTATNAGRTGNVTIHGGGGTSAQGSGVVVDNVTAKSSAGAVGDARVTRGGIAGDVTASGSASRGSELDATASGDRRADRHEARRQLERRFQTGWRMLKAGKVREAARELGAAADAAPEEALAADARYWQAVALVRAGQSRDAERVLLAFLDHAPSSLRRGRASLLLGRLIGARGDIANARTWLQSVIDDPDRETALEARKALDALPAAGVPERAR